MNSASPGSSLARKIRLRAADALLRSPIPALRHVTIHESDHSLILTGQLPSEYYRQLAVDTVEPFLNGRTLVNQVVIVPKG